MKYGVFTAGSSDLLCVGSEEECAEALGATTDQFKHWVNNPDAGYREGISIYTIESENPLQCPCDFCQKAPTKPFGTVSASCDITPCEKHENWMKRYWKQLRKRYYQKK